MERLEQIFLYDENAPLLFTRFFFWAFFAALLIIYCILYKKKAVRNAYLFLMSLFFYYKSGGYFFSLLIFSTIVDYTLGLAIHNASKPWRRKLFVTLSVITNLGVLAYFKYSYLFIDTINGIFNTDLEVVNVLAQWTNGIAGTGFDVSSIILPVGISFYTFQTISYSVDVYRRKVEPVRNILDFGFYVSFFPQLVAGPIVRAASFVPQLYKEFQLSKREFGFALFLILNGLIKKIVISDYISINYVDRVFATPDSYTGFENLMAVYGYGIQIYCDFSGYTDIAIGVALLMGFRLPLNFNSPYKAHNITDFWRRWHISLSSWLRDYLYIPLGGNRKGRIRTYINLMLTMLLGGLWHGASWRFVIWGGIHGVALAIDKLWALIFPKKEKVSVWRRIFSIFITFHIVHVAWIFFRAQSMEKVGLILSRIVNDFNFALVPEMIGSYKLIFGIILGGFIIHWIPAKTKEWYQNLFIKTPLFIKIIICLLTALLLYQAKSADIQPFIYFQF